MRGGEVRAGRAGGPGVRWRHDKRHARGKGPTHGLGAKGTRGAHVEHVVHGRDAGGVNAQRLVEGRRGLPSRRGGHAMRGEEVRAGRRVGLWGGGGTTSGMHGEKVRLKAWGPRACAKRTENMWLMVVTLEVSTLSGWLKAVAYCRVEGRACDAGGRGASREAGGPGVRWRHDKRHARGKGPTHGLGAKGTRGAHGEHAVHDREAGGVEAQRLVESCALSSRREGMQCGGERCEPGGGRGGLVRWRHDKRHARGWPDSRLGGQGHARSARRTWSACS
jgi:hypothetical protein